MHWSALCALGPAALLVAALWIRKKYKEQPNSGVFENSKWLKQLQFVHHANSVGCVVFVMAALDELIAAPGLLLELVALTLGIFGLLSVVFVQMVRRDTEARSFSGLKHDVTFLYGLGIILGVSGLVSLSGYYTFPFIKSLF